MREYKMKEKRVEVKPNEKKAEKESSVRLPPLRIPEEKDIDLEVDGTCGRPIYLGS